MAHTMYKITGKFLNRSSKNGLSTVETQITTKQKHLYSAILLEFVQTTYFKGFQPFFIYCLLFDFII